jgi:acyl-CoA synthetase (NDP forming)
MFGMGGIFTEILKDTSFRVAPIEKYDALQMMDEIRAKDILGPFRGSEPVDREVLAEALIAVGNIGMEFPNVSEIDINPVIISGSVPVAVDALVVLAEEK